MYNTCFWSLVLQGGLTAQEANKELSVRLLFSNTGLHNTAEYYDSL